MSPPEFLIAAISIVSIFVAFPYIIVNGIVRAKKAKLEVKDGAGSMRMSELQALIEVAVEEATAPLYRRIEQLEHAEPGRLEAPRPALSLELPDEEVEEPVATPRTRIGS